jgi:DNA replication protein DnaD
LDPKKTHSPSNPKLEKKKKKPKELITNVNKSMHNIYNYKIEIGRHSHDVNSPKKTHTHALNPSTKKKLKENNQKERDEKKATNDLVKTTSRSPFVRLKGRPQT